MEDVYGDGATGGYTEQRQEPVGPAFAQIGHKKGQQTYRHLNQCITHHGRGHGIMIAMVDIGYQYQEFYRMDNGESQAGAREK